MAPSPHLYFLGSHLFHILTLRTHRGSPVPLYLFLFLHLRSTSLVLGRYGNRYLCRPWRCSVLITLLYSSAAQLLRPLSRITLPTVRPWIPLARSRSLVRRPIPLNRVAACLIQRSHVLLVNIWIVPLSRNFKKDSRRICLTIFFVWHIGSSPRLPRFTYTHIALFFDDTVALSPYHSAGYTAPVLLPVTDKPSDVFASSQNSRHYSRCPIDEENDNSHDS